MNTTDVGRKALIIIGIFLCLMFLVGQTGSLIDYEFTVSIDLQDSIEEITAVGVAWAKGFAFGDTLIYLPLFIAGLIGTIYKKKWGLVALCGALAITAYWPIVCLYAIFVGKGAMNLRPDKYNTFTVILIPISIYGLWGIWFIYRKWNDLLKEA